MSHANRLFFALLFIIFTFGTQAKESQKSADKSTTVCPPSPCDCSKTGKINCDNQGFSTVSLAPNKIDPDSVIELSMRSNKITQLLQQEILLGKTARLTRLILTSNFIAHIQDGAFQNAIELKDLDLTKNKLTTLGTRTFEGLGNLVNLWLDHNLIDDLSNAGQVFSPLSKLRLLSMDNTPLKKISNETFIGLDSLIELSIDHAELSFLTVDSFKPLLRVETLSLRHNRFHVVPLEELVWLAQLKRLDLSGNPIKTISSNSFRHNSHLRSLSFYNMSELIVVEDCAFCNLHELRSLEIVNCSKFNDIDPDAFGRNNMYFQYLETIDLMNNSLNTLDEDMLPWENVSGMIRLSGNPFVCDCEIDWMMTPGLKFDKLQPPTCQSPTSLKDQPIPTLRDFDSLFCIMSRLKPRIRTARLFLMLAIVVIVAGILTATWYVFIHRRGMKIRNLFYKPQLPKYAYRNLAMGDDAAEPDSAATASNDGASIVPKEKGKPNRDLAARLAEQV